MSCELVGVWIAALLSGCHPADPDSGAATGCAADPGCTLAQDLPAGLLSVRARSATDVWVVGASPPSGGGPVLASFDGAAWSTWDTSAFEGIELWWLWVDADRIVAVGSQGALLEGDRAAGTLTRIDGPDADITFFGVWGASADRLWAVGQQSTDEGDHAVAWTRAGGVWSPLTDLPLPEGASALFKVHGDAAGRVYMVGAEGLVLAGEDGAFAVEATDADLPTSTALLLTVDAGAPRPVVVGGAGSALVLEREGDTWKDHSPDFVPALNGVCSDGDIAWAVGQHGTRLQRQGESWVSDLDRGVDLGVFEDWHACAVDDEGGLWVVGGDIAARPLTAGRLLYQGPGEPPAWE
ncbi:MAG: hypothetical protein H6742_18090 [Alphaproteobacteria bacterium]|nr:hypothetical protein [Alphaproteobacteria bacterium]